MRDFVCLMLGSERLSECLEAGDLKLVGALLVRSPSIRSERVFRRSEGRSPSWLVGASGEFFIFYEPFRSQADGSPRLIATSVNAIKINNP